MLVEPSSCKISILLCVGVGYTHVVDYSADVPARHYHDRRENSDTHLSISQHTIFIKIRYYVYVLVIS